MEVVENRRQSILKKREKKEYKKKLYHSKREDKYILQAGYTFLKEKDVSKFDSILLKDRTRSRKKEND